MPRAACPGIRQTTTPIADRIAGDQSGRRGLPGSGEHGRSVAGVPCSTLALGNVHPSRAIRCPPANVGGCPDSTSSIRRPVSPSARRSPTGATKTWTPSAVVLRRCAGVRTSPSPSATANCDFSPCISQVGMLVGRARLGREPSRDLRHAEGSDFRSQGLGRPPGGRGSRFRHPWRLQPPLRRQRRLGLESAVAGIVSARSPDRGPRIPVRSELRGVHRPHRARRCRRSLAGPRSRPVSGLGTMTTRTTAPSRLI